MCYTFHLLALACARMRLSEAVLKVTSDSGPLAKVRLGRPPTPQTNLGDTPDRLLKPASRKPACHTSLPDALISHNPGQHFHALGQRLRYLKLSC